MWCSPSCTIVSEGVPGLMVVSPFILEVNFLVKEMGAGDCGVEWARLWEEVT